MEQSGWRSCRHCQGLVSTRVGSMCLDEKVHEFGSGADYRAVWIDFPENAQRGWGVCIRCGRLVCRFMGGGVCYDRAAHEFDELSGEYGVHLGPSPDGTQAGWRWCSRCQCLCDANNPSHRCFAEGDHDFSGSGEYSVPIVPRGLRGEWKWCNKCQGLFQEAGVCHDGEPHQQAGFDAYFLTYGVTPEGAQSGWRLCTKCSLLGFSEAPTSACYAEGAHEFSTTLTYSILKDTSPNDAQPGWRLCGKCGSMNYGHVTAPCPAGGTHEEGDSPYSIFPEQLNGGQPGWRACGKCRAMNFSQLSPGVCRDGFPHDLSASNSYSIPWGEAPIGGESSWRHCSRCEGLASQAGPGGVCFDGGPHDLLDSSLYGLPIEFPPDGAEAGWRRCTRCQQLAFEGSNGEPGICVGGNPHDFGGSPAYSIAVERTISPPPVSEPQLELTESEASIVVDGAGFTAKASIEVSFVAGASSIKVPVTADEQGHFQYTVDQVIAREKGGVVTAAEKDGGLASARLRSFVPAPVEPQG